MSNHEEDARSGDEISAANEPGFSRNSAAAGKRVRVVGVWRRCAAAVVDSAVIVPVLAASGWIGMQVAGVTPSAGTWRRPELLLELLLSGGPAFYATLAVGIVVIMIYATLFVSVTGRTPGLALMRAQVINLYGDRPEPWRVLVRCIGIACGFASLGLGLLWTGFDREKRGMHDWIAGTYVIHIKAIS